MRRSALVVGTLVAVFVAPAAQAADPPVQSGVQSAAPSGVATPAPTAPAQSAVPSAPQSAVPNPSQSAVPSPPQSAVQSVAPEAAEAILGQRVTDPEGGDLGRLIDVLVDMNGQPQAAVVDFGGFMGVGNRKVALHWSLLHFNPGGDPKHKITLDITPDQIKGAPEFLNPNKPAAVVTPADAASTSP